MPDTEYRDVYEIPVLAERQLEEDTQAFRRSLYTGTKENHPADWLTGKPCGCQAGDDSWTHSGNVMRVVWPDRDTEREAG